MDNAAKQIILKIIKARPKNYAEFLILKRKLSNELKVPPLTNATLIEALRQIQNAKADFKSAPALMGFLTKRAIRTMSGVAPITVLTKPYACPGHCLYCPLEPGMPKSYLSNEPAAQRAKNLNFDPARQVKLRIKALEANGHIVDKIELLILGGSFNAYPKKYQQWFIKKCFNAGNGRSTKTLADAFRKNETAKYRIIGTTIETRPDLINEKEIKWFRELGVTRVQLGVQHLDDKILKNVRRGHTVKQTVAATKLLKQAGFKIDYHLMPDLPSSTPAKDLAMFKKLFTNQDFQPDQIKIYPTVVNEFAPLYQWFKKGKYRPYSEKQLLDLLVKIKSTIPYYVRINRLIRDIPKESIIAGNKITNLRQILQEKMKKLARRSRAEAPQERRRGVGGCKCIRCREAKEDITNLKQAKLFTKKYPASGGTEYFISYESPKRDKLYSFIRLRFNDIAATKEFILGLPEIKDAALVRELHTYGKLVQTGFKPVSSQKSQTAQHLGFGKRLMKIAEDLTLKHGLKKIAVISGIGVRQYYHKLGYRLEGTYMVKYLR